MVRVARAYVFQRYPLKFLMRDLDTMLEHWFAFFGQEIDRFGREPPLFCVTISQ
jgi:hypothetical protein